MERIEIRLKSLLLLIGTIGFLSGCQSDSLNTKKRGFTENNLIITLNDSVNSFSEAIQSDFVPLKSTYPNLGEHPSGIWLKKEITSTSATIQSYTFVTRGVDTLEC
jgi:hypothetical protein